MAITEAGVSFLAQAITGEGVLFNAANTRIGVGNGNTAFNKAQTDLQGGSTFRKSVDVGYPIVNAPSVSFKATFRQNEANFAWNEWGIFNAASGGVMLNRVVESNGVKQDNQTWVLEVEITFEVGA